MAYSGRPLDAVAFEQHSEYMEITISLDDRVAEQIARQAEAKGTTVDQLVREYVEQLAKVEISSEEFDRLFRQPTGDSRGWKFNREELYDRK
jgi:hypothetical protein